MGPAQEVIAVERDGEDSHPEQDDDPRGGGGAPRMVDQHPGDAEVVALEAVELEDRSLVALAGAEEPFDDGGEEGRRVDQGEEHRDREGEGE